MLAYIDSSALLRVIFGEKSQLADFHKIESAVSSDLLRVECLRTIDRIRVDKKFTDSEYVTRVQIFYSYFESFEIIPLHRDILTRASQPFPTRLGTLDAIHLASGIVYRERNAQEVVFCSHDISLKNAAQALGFRVLG